MKVREIMTDRVVTVRPADSVSEAARLMRDAEIGDVLITGDDGRPMGILTDRDIAVRVVAQELDTSRSPVGDFMTKPLYTASPRRQVHRGRYVKPRVRVTSSGQPSLNAT